MADKPENLVPAAINNPTPHNVVPASVNNALHGMVQRQLEKDPIGVLVSRTEPKNTPKVTLPKGDPIADASVRGEANPHDTAFSMAAVTDAIPGEVFGAQHAMLEALRAETLTPAQQAAFYRGGEELVRQAVKNPGLLETIHAVDFNGDNHVSRREAAAGAAAIDFARTFEGKSFDQIAADFGSKEFLARAQQFNVALPESAPPTTNLAEKATGKGGPGDR